VRIVLVGTAYPLRGGIAHYTALLYRHLTRKGHDVEVLSFKRQYPAFLFPGKTQIDEGVELIPLRSVPLLDSTNPVSWIRTFFWLKKSRVDLLLFKYWMPFFAPCYATVAFLARTFLNIPILYLCDNIVPHESNVADRTLSRIGLRFVDFFIVQSETVLRDLLLYRPDAVYRKVPHPVYEIFPPPLPKTTARKKLGIRDQRVILYFGYIRAYKGVPCLIRATAWVVKKRLHVKLLICGEFYEGREEALDLIDQLHLHDVVQVYDRFIPNEDVGLYFCASDLVVLPYVSATQSGIVQVAYHYNKPVVVTRVGGLPEAVSDGKTGYVVPPENPEALGNAILSFYRDKKENAFVRNVKKEKQKYSWDRMVEAIESFMASGH